MQKVNGTWFTFSAYWNATHADVKWQLIVHSLESTWNLRHKQWQLVRERTTLGNATIPAVTGKQTTMEQLPQRTPGWSLWRKTQKLQGAEGMVGLEINGRKEMQSKQTWTCRKAQTHGTCSAVSCLFQAVTLLWDKHAHWSFFFNCEHRIASKHGTLGCRWGCLQTWHHTSVFCFFFCNITAANSVKGHIWSTDSI